MSETDSLYQEKLAVLRQKYGELLTVGELAEVLRYRTVAAAKKAHSRGTLPVKLVRLKGRHESFARLEDVARYLCEIQ